MSALHDPASLGAIIKQARKAAGLTQEVLAAQANVSRRTLITIENGHVRAELGLVLAVLRALDLELRVGPREKPRAALDELFAQTEEL